MAEQSNLKRQDRIRLCGIGIGLVAAILTCEVPEQSQWAGWDIERAVRNPSFGSGSGSPGRLRGKRKGTSLKPVNLWERIRQNQDDKRLQDLIHLSVSQFEGLLLKFKEENFPEKFGTILLLLYLLTFQNLLPVKLSLKIKSYSFSSGLFNTHNTQHWR